MCIFAYLLICIYVYTYIYIYIYVCGILRSSEHQALLPLQRLAPLCYGRDPIAQTRSRPAAAWRPTLPTAPTPQQHKTREHTPTQLRHTIEDTMDKHVFPHLLFFFMSFQMCFNVLFCVCDFVMLGLLFLCFSYNIITLYAFLCLFACCACMCCLVILVLRFL